MDKLTQKEELFCTLVVVEGLSQRQAYRETYVTNASDEVVDVAASRLSKKAKVRLRSEELRTALVSPSIADRKERIELWSDIARDGGEKTADRLRATELLGKAQGDFIERTENKNLNVHAQLDRLEVLTDDQIDELLAIVVY
jgi:phage terminase small subunit